MVVMYFLMLWLWVAFPMALFSQYVVDVKNYDLGFALWSSFLVALLFGCVYKFGLT
jgi:hypothetical protein